MALVQVLLPFTLLAGTSFIHFIYYSCLNRSKNVLFELSLVAMYCHDKNGMEQRFLSAIKGLGRVNDSSEPVDLLRKLLDPQDGRSSQIQLSKSTRIRPKRLSISIPNAERWSNPSRDSQSY